MVINDAPTLQNLLATLLQVDPLYIAEIAPASHRGELVSWAELGVNVISIDMKVVHGMLDQYK